MGLRAKDLQDVGVASGTEYVIVVDAGGALKRMNMGQARGAGWFWGSDPAAPSTDFSVSATGWPTEAGPYRAGDMYRRTVGSNTTIYYWQASDSTWQVQEELTKQTFWDVNSSVVNHEQTVIAFNDPNMIAGDYYRNFSNGKVFGPHVEGTGITFDPDAGLFHFERGPIEHSSVEDLTWNPWDTVDKLAIHYMPRDNDTYRQPLIDGGHGGYLWRFDKAAYDADGGNVLAKRIAGWGTRAEFREPILRSEDNRPAGLTSYNDTKYIAGDTVLARDTLIVWGPYVAGQADQAAAWPTNTSVRAERIYHTSHDTEIVPDDGAQYQDGDFLIHTTTPTGATPLVIMYGPYDSTNGWEILSVLRGVTTSVNTQLISDEFFQVNLTTSQHYLTRPPIVGDTLERRYIFITGNANGKTVGELTGKYKLSTVIAVDHVSKAVTHSAEYNPKGITMHSTPVEGRLLADDNWFDAGDLLTDSAGAIFGPYVEGAATDIIAWPVKKAADTGGIRIQAEGGGAFYTIRIAANGDIFTEEIT